MMNKKKYYTIGYNLNKSKKGEELNVSIKAENLGYREIKDLEHALFHIRKEYEDKNGIK